MKTAQNKTNREVQPISTKNIRDIAKIRKELFPSKLFKNIKQNQGGFWKPTLLATTALLWMIVGEPTILIEFEFAFDIHLAAIPGSSPSSPAPRYHPRTRKNEGHLSGLHRTTGEISIASHHIIFA